NCLILQRRQIRPHPFGIPENDFALLDGRVNMITKAPIRLLTLSALELGNHSCFWDIGFCTGSVSIEARLQFPHLRVEAFEIRSQGEELMRKNSHRFGVPGIGVHMGDFLQLDLSGIERPDAVFIGGHGGRLVEVVRRVQDVLLPGGVLVFNSVSQESQQVFRKAVKDAGMHLQDEIYVALDKHNPITIMSAK
ncbi:MAG: precorrin-6Y C5,15-methyltransferase (decarboxylating) subunit CbiT, partial [Bacteroidaceae bacterium]|nr:precorrin-6Y C5,15-methyltransferase (decarboxylating) subunit CbiT [Bacteroidaceae bacterium]